MSDAIKKRQPGATLPVNQSRQLSPGHVLWLTCGLAGGAMEAMMPGWVRTGIPDAAIRIMS